MTSRKQAIAELVERLERASGPSRELDAAVADLIHGKQSWGSPSVEWCRLYHAKPTSSIDAAMTLLPGQWTKDIWLKRYGGHHWSCELHIPSYEQEGRHAHLPMAIGIAALRAIAAEHEKSPTTGNAQ